MTEKIFKKIKTERDWVAEMERDLNDEIADLLYTEYCKAVNNVDFQGFPLPTWEEFRGDVKKQRQANAWVAVARLARSIELE